MDKATRFYIKFYRFKSDNYYVYETSSFIFVYR